MSQIIWRGGNKTRSVGERRRNWDPKGNFFLVVPLPLCCPGRPSMDRNDLPDLRQYAQKARKRPPRRAAFLCRFYSSAWRMDSHKVRSTAENSARVTVSEGDRYIAPPELWPANRPTDTDHSMAVRAQEATCPLSA